MRLPVRHFGLFGNAGNGIITEARLIDFDMVFFQCCEHTYGDGAFGQVAGTADPWVIQFALRWSS